MRAGIRVLPRDAISLPAPFAAVLGLNLTRKPGKKINNFFQNTTAEYCGSITSILNYSRQYQRCTWWQTLTWPGRRAV